MKISKLFFLLILLPGVLLAQLPWSTPQLLCDSIGENLNPAFVRTYEGMIDYNALLWQREYGTHSEIFLKDFMNPDSEISVTAPLSNIRNQHPQASLIDTWQYPGPILIVWESDLNGNLDLYSIIYDNGVFSQFSQITNHTYDDTNASLVGNNLVWERDSSIWYREYSPSDSAWSPPELVDSGFCASPGVGHSENYPQFSAVTCAYQKRVGNGFKIFLTRRDTAQLWTPPELLPSPGNSINPHFSTGYDAPVLWQSMADSTWDLFSYSFWQQDTVGFHFSNANETNPEGLLIPLITDGYFDPLYLAFESDSSGDPEIFANDWPFYLQDARNISQHPGLDVNPAISSGGWSEAMQFDLRVWIAWERYQSGQSQIYGSYAEITVGAIDDDAAQLPQHVTLYQNYPNPFNSETVISFQLSAISQIELSIYNLLGQKVRTLFSENMPAGEHHVKWDGRNDAGRAMTSGIYVYRLRSIPPSKGGRGDVQSRKMLLLR